MTKKLDKAPVDDEAWAQYVLSAESVAELVARGKERPLAEKYVGQLAVRMDQLMRKESKA